MLNIFQIHKAVLYLGYKLWPKLSLCNGSWLLVVTYSNASENTCHLTRNIPTPTSQPCQPPSQPPSRVARTPAVHPSKNPSSTRSTPPHSKTPITTASVTSMESAPGSTISSLWVPMCFGLVSRLRGIVPRGGAAELIRGCRSDI